MVTVVNTRRLHYQKMLPPHALLRKAAKSNVKESEYIFIHACRRWMHHCVRLQQGKVQMLVCIAIYDCSAAVAWCWKQEAEDDVAHRLRLHGRRCRICRITGRG